MTRRRRAVLVSRFASLTVRAIGNFLLRKFVGKISVIYRQERMRTRADVLRIKN
jgi:hypothetical protein